MIQSGILFVQLSILGWTKWMSNNVFVFDYVARPEHLESPRAHKDSSPVIKFTKFVNSYLPDVRGNVGFGVFGDTTLSVLFDGFLVAVLLALFLALLCNALIALGIRLNLLSFVNRFLAVLENEFIAARTFFIIVATVATLLLLSVFSPSMGLQTPLVVYLYLYFAAIVASLIILWPVSLLFNWGAYASVYIKGESTTLNLLGQVVMDYFYVVSFFLRINLQFLRIIVLSSVFILYNEFYFEFIYPNYNYQQSLTSSKSWSDFTFTSVKWLIAAVLRFLYELGHVWVVVIMQANAFSMILLLILQSLHTVYLLQKLSNYYNEKRI